MNRNKVEVMKKSSLALVLAFAFATAAGALAGEKTKDSVTKPAKTTPVKKAKKSQTPAPASETVMFTGSYIKQTVERNGQITSGPNALYVIDSKTIQNSGAADLRQLLIRQGQYH